MEFCDEYHNLNPNKNTQETWKFGRKWFFRLFLRWKWRLNAI